MNWISVKDEVPESGIKILIYSGIDGDNTEMSMSFRIIDSQFLSMYMNVTHWLRLVFPASVEE